MTYWERSTRLEKTTPSDGDFPASGKNVRFLWGGFNTYAFPCSGKVSLSCGEGCRISNIFFSSCGQWDRLLDRTSQDSPDRADTVWLNICAVSMHVLIECQVTALLTCKTVERLKSFRTIFTLYIASGAGSYSNKQRRTLSKQKGQGGGEERNHNREDKQSWGRDFLQKKIMGKTTHTLWLCPTKS